MNSNLNLNLKSYILKHSPHHNAQCYISKAPFEVQSHYNPSKQQRRNRHTKTHNLAGIIWGEFFPPNIFFPAENAPSSPRSPGNPGNFSRWKTHKPGQAERRRRHTKLMPARASKSIHHQTSTHPGQGKCFSGLALPQGYTGVTEAAIKCWEKESLKNEKEHSGVK